MIENHKDVERTKAARKSGEFLERGSYYNLAGHVFLRGRDRMRQRWKVFASSKGKCAICEERCDEHQGDYDHVKGGRKHARCDCFHLELNDGTHHTNVQWVHAMELQDSCHKTKHHRDLVFKHPWKK